MARIRHVLAASSVLAVLWLAPQPALAHGGGGGGHGGGGHVSSGGGHTSTGSNHGSGPFTTTRSYHGGGGGSGANTRDASYIDGPLTFNPYDLPAARMHRYFQNLFHHDAPAQP